MSRLFSRIIMPLHLLAIAAVLLQPTTPAVIGQYSRTALIVLGALIISTPLIYLWTRWLSRPRTLTNNPEWQKILGFLGGISSLLIVWAGFSSPTPSYIVLQIYISLLIISAYSHFFLSAQPADNPLTFRHATGVATCLLVFILLIGLSSEFPGLLWTDEGFNSGLAMSFAQKGILGVPALRYEASGPMFSIFYMGLGGWYSLFGISLLAGRTYSILVGILSLSLLYALLRRAYSTFAALGAVLLASAAFISMNYLRADVSVSVYIAIALFAFFQAGQKAQNRYHFIVGLASGFALDGHPNAYRFIIAFALFYGLEYGLPALRQRKFGQMPPLLLLLAGQITGIAAYLGLYTLIAPDSFWAAFNAPGESFVFSIPHALTLFADQLIATLLNVPVLFAGAVFGAILCFRSGSRFERLLGFVFVATPLIFALTYGYFRTYYLTESISLWAALCGVAVYRFQPYLKDRDAVAERNAATGLMALFAAIVLGQIVRGIANVKSQDYSEVLRVARHVRTIVPRDQVLVGVDPMFFRLYDYPDFIDFGLGPMLAAKQNIDESEAWASINPDAVVIVPEYPIEQRGLLVYVVEQDFVRVRCWQTENLGDVALYMQELPAGMTVEDECVGL